MVKLIWTNEAIDDLNAIGEYISESSEKTDTQLIAFYS